MLKSRKNKFLTTREGCGSQLEIVLKGAKNNIFSEQKAALTALDRLYEERCVSALIYVMNEFSGSDDPFKQHLAKKAREYLKRDQGQ